MARRSKWPQGPSEAEQAVDPEAVARLRERNEQARVYAELVREERKIADDYTQIVIDTWASHFGAVEVDGEYSCGTFFPERITIARFIRAIGLAAVLDAVDLTRERFSMTRGIRASKYFYGVCRNKQHREEGTDGQA